MDGPASSYSAFEIQKFEKVESEAIRDPPLHTEYFLSEESDVTTLIFGGNLLCISSISISFAMRSANPGKSVLPPERTVLL